MAVTCSANGGKIFWSESKATDLILEIIQLLPHISGWEGQIRQVESLEVGQIKLKQRIKMPSMLIGQQIL